MEAWLSKKYEKNLRRLRKEFEAMGTTRASLWVYPAENPSRTVAIGRCVPGYIARHALNLTEHYLGKVNSLVHQSFISPYWIGIGTSLFAENSQQPVDSDQVAQLKNRALDTVQFQELYRKLTRQDETVPAFGLEVPNPKYMVPQETRSR